MKKFWSLLLCVAMLSAIFVIPANAVTPANIFEVSGSNIHHYYMGEEAAVAPVQNGVIGANEYSTSSALEGFDVKITDNYTGADIGTGYGISNIVQYFSYDEDYWYMALAMKDTDTTTTKKSVTFSFNFNSMGGFSDICSRASITLTMKSATTATLSTSYLDQHSAIGGDHAVNYEPQYENICDSYAAKHDTATNTVVYEIAIKLDGIREEYGFTVGEAGMYYAHVTNAQGNGMYCPTLTSDQRAAIAASSAAHSTPAILWGAHIVHFGPETPAAVKNADFKTIDGASVRLKSAEDAGIRFATEFDKDYIEDLRDSGKKVEIGTLIAPLANVKAANGVFTKEALDAAPIVGDVKYANVKGDIYSPYNVGTDTYTYAGSLIQIKDKSILFAGIGYITVDGVTTYSDSYAVRSVSGIAFSALRDMSKISRTGYTNATQLGSKTATTYLSNADAKVTVYSPYTRTERDILFELASGYNTSSLTDFFPLEAKAAGNIRVVTSNMFFHEMNWVHNSKAYEPTNSDINAAFDRKANALAMTGADVILLQEMSEGIRSGGGNYRMHSYLDPRLAAKGYTQVNPIDSTPPTWVSGHYQAKNINQTPIWYNDATLDLVAAGHEYYDTMDDADVGDGDLSDSKAFTWALFKETATGKQFIAISTHFSYHGDATLGAQKRLANATQLVNYINANLISYNVPIIVGGDLNTTRNGAPYKTLVDNATAKLENARNNSTVSKNGTYGTSHGYCNTDLTTTPKYSVTLPTVGGNPIDHILVSETGLDIKQYMTIVTDEFSYATDHVPLLIDFTIE
ncbi:MAG: hypothetical protein E7641_02010 [Ruminococcaceae bacterium]|nr:hypothetical protein [Oscillospiraceae bacterium]